MTDEILKSDTPYKLASYSGGSDGNNSSTPQQETGSEAE